MALYSQGGFTSPDIYIGLFSLALTIASILLNTLVFIYNYKKHRSVPRFLFMVLSSIDFATGLIVGTFITGQVLKGGDPLCEMDQNVEERSCAESREMPIKLYGCVDFLLSQTPGFVAATMSICRYRQLRRPFRTISQSLVGWAIVGYCFVVFIVLVCSMTIKPDYFYFSYHTFTPWFDEEAFGLGDEGQSDTRKRLIIFSYLLVTWPTFPGQLVSIVASAFTVKHLQSTRQHKSYKRGSNPKISAHVQADKRSSIKIILTNSGGIIQTVYLFALCEVILELENLSTASMISGFVMGVLPVFLSVLNPVIFIVFTPKLRESCSRRFQDSLNRGQYPVRTVSFLKESEF